MPEGEGGGGGSLSLQKASLTGDAQITVNRGKRKHIYDFSATVDWELDMAGDADSLKGELGPAWSDELGMIYSLIDCRIVRD